MKQLRVLVKQAERQDPLDDQIGLAPYDSASSDLAAGQTIGEYSVLGVLGSGGMAQVYRAVRAGDTLHQEVALKIERWDSRDPLQQSRFVAEGKVLAGLAHPAIARVLDSGRCEMPLGGISRLPGLGVDRRCSDRSVLSRHSVVSERGLEAVRALLRGC